MRVAARKVVAPWSEHRVRRTATMLFAAVACVAGVPAAAQGYAVRTLGGWTLAPSSDAPGCFMTRDYGGDGGTTVLFGLDADGRNHLSLLNSNWSIHPRDRLKLDLRLSGRRYADQVAIGMVSDGKQGFVTEFGTRFATDFAASRFLHIDRGDVPVARLTLNGSGAAIAELKRCIAAVAAKPSAKASDGGGAGVVPRDPFSPGLDKLSRKRRAAAEE